VAEDRPLGSFDCRFRKRLDGRRLEQWGANNKVWCSIYFLFMADPRPVVGSKNVISGCMKMSCRLVQFPGRPVRTAETRNDDGFPRSWPSAGCGIGVRYLRQVPDAQIYFSVLLAIIRAGKQVSRFHVLFFMSSPRFPMLWLKACAVDRGDSPCFRFRATVVACGAWIWCLGKYTRYGGIGELNWYPGS
jgi:hypothetical protein